MHRSAVGTNALLRERHCELPPLRRGLLKGAAVMLMALLLSMGALQAQTQAAAQPTGSDGLLQGQVSDTTADPVSGATVEIRRQSDDSLVAQTSTDSSGEFGPESVPPDSYVVEASRQFYISSSRNVTVNAGTTEAVNLVLERGSGFLSGEVTDSDATPIGGADIVIVDQADGSLAAQLTSASDGTFGTQLTAANYTVTIDHPDYVLFSSQVTIEANQTRSLFAVLLGDLIFESRFESKT